MNKKIVIFGAGSAGHKVSKWLPAVYDIMAFVDNDPKKHGSKINGLPVYSPDWLADVQYDCVLVASQYAAQIYTQLEHLNISDRLIEIEGFKEGLFVAGYPWHHIGKCLKPRLENLEVNLDTITQLLAEYRVLPVYRALNLIKDKLSMLHVDVLQLLWHLVRYNNGAVLEIGPYLGGSTVAMGLAMKQRSQLERIVTIEAGGTNPGLHFIASENIITELKYNLLSFSVDDVIDVIEGDSRSSSVVNQICNKIKKKSVQIVFHDADGRVDLDIIAHQSIIADQFYLIIDDYISPNDPEKEKRTRDALEKLKETLEMESCGVYGWGTLFIKARFIYSDSV